MNSLDRAKNMLKEEELSFVAIKDLEVYTSKLNGVKPIMQKIRTEKEFFKDFIIVDKVIGKSAAALLIRSGSRHIHGVILSKHAQKIIEKNNISYSYDKLVPFIINRNKDGMCPMESSVLEINDLEEAYIAISKKIEDLMALK